MKISHNSSLFDDFENESYECESFEKISNPNNHSKVLKIYERPSKKKKKYNRKNKANITY